MKASTKKTWTYSDYLKIDDDKRYEIIDGRLIEMAGASFEHQRILLKIIMRIEDFVSRFNFGKVIPASFDVVQADLVIEIISEGSKRKDKFKKKKLTGQKGKVESKLLGDFRLDLREVFYES